MAALSPHMVGKVIALDRSALDRLIDLIGDDPADLVDMMESFLADAETLVASMADTDDLTRIARAAHTLKSNARDFGATELAARCEKLEHDLKTGQPPDDLPGQVAAIGALWPEVMAAIQNEIAAAGAK